MVRIQFGAGNYKDVPNEGTLGNLLTDSVKQEIALPSAGNIEYTLDGLTINTHQFLEHGDVVLCVQRAQEKG